MKSEKGLRGWKGSGHSARVVMEQTFEPYRRLAERMREIALVDSAGSLLSWDQETYMPPKAIGYRADQLAFLSGWTHRLFTAPEVGQWIGACQERGYARESVEAVNVREWRRRYQPAGFR